MIPYSLWKIWGIAAAGGIAWFAMFWIGLSNSLGAEFQEVVSLQNRRITTFFSTICLLTATQLSALIFWHRVRSKKDFSGRYRIWILSTLFWGLACWSVTTNFHLVVANWAQQRWPISFWPRGTLYWAGPVAVAFLALHRLIQLEMRGSRWSRFVWDPTWLLAVTTLWITLLPNVFADREWQGILQQAASTLWHLLTAIALLVHARYVVHVNNEAAPRQPSGIIRVFHAAHGTAEKLVRSIPKIPRPKFLSQRYSLTGESAARPVGRDRTTGQSSAAPGRATPQASPKPVEKALEPAERKATPAREAATETSSASLHARPATSGVVPVPTPSPPVAATAAQAAQPPQPRSSTPTEDRSIRPAAGDRPASEGNRVLGPLANANRVRVDAAHPQQAPATPPVTESYSSPDEDDEEDDSSGEYAGLSRKERRRLKKQQRQQR